MEKITEEEKNSKKSYKIIRAGIAFFSGAAGVVLNLIKSHALTDENYKSFFQALSSICFGIAAIILIYYIVVLFERWNRIGNKYEDILKNQKDINGDYENIWDRIRNKCEDILKNQKDINDDCKNIGKRLEILCKDIEHLKLERQENACPVQYSNYVVSSEEVNNKLFELLKNRAGEIRELHIICFGRNGFGGAVKHIIDQRIDINVKIIVFNPKSHIDICQKDDDVIIRKNMETWFKGSDKIDVIVSEVPPMVRAAVAYTSDTDKTLHAIWGTMQSYRFARDPETGDISLEKPANSLISVCEENKSVAFDLHALVNSFEEEFGRLEKYSHRYTGKQALF